MNRSSSAGAATQAIGTILKAQKNLTHGDIWNRHVARKNNNFGIGSVLVISRYPNPRYLNFGKEKNGIVTSNKNHLAYLLKSAPNDVYHVSLSLCDDACRLNVPKHFYVE